MKTTWIFFLEFPHLILSIVFSQSGMDKLLDWKGNLTWIRAHFAKSPIAPAAALLLVLLTMLETLGGVLGLIGVGMALWFGFNALSLLVLEISLVLLGFALAGLMLGQRIAKDYAGAANLTGYCILLSLCFLSLLYVQS